MYIKKEGSCRISIEKKIRFFIKKRRFFSLQKKRRLKEKRRIKEGNSPSASFALKVPKIILFQMLD